MMGLGGQRSRRVRHLGTTWRRTASAYAVQLLPSMRVARLVGAPLNKNAMELKTPKQEARERYLPLKAGRLTSAKPHHKKSQVALVTFKRLLMWDGPATGRLCARRCTCGTCVCTGETGDAFETRPFYNQGGESWSDSEGIPWGFHSFQMVGIPLRTPVILQSHRASWARLRTMTTWALCLEDMMRLAHHSWTMKGPGLKPG
jgi:hypothetical protein